MNRTFFLILYFLLGIPLAGCVGAGGTRDAVDGGTTKADRESIIAPTSLGTPRPTDTPMSVETVDFETNAWSYQGNDGHLITTPHYRLYTTIRYDRVVNRLPLFYERALQQYHTALADLPLPDKPMDSYLFQSRRQWKLKTNEVLPQRAGMFMNLGRGGFTTRGISVLYYIDYRGYSRDTLAIAAHEGWHQFTQTTFRHPLPVWLEEGIASYMEGYFMTDEGKPIFDPSANRERRNELRSARRENRLIPLMDLLKNTPQDFLRSGRDELLTYYAQVWALVRYLAEGESGAYASDLAEVLTDASQGRLAGRMFAARNDASKGARGNDKTGPAVISEYITPDLEAFQSGYERFVETLTQSSGRPRMRPHSRHN